MELKPPEVPEFPEEKSQDFRRLKIQFFLLLRKKPASHLILTKQNLTIMISLKLSDNKGT